MLASVDVLYVYCKYDLSLACKLKFHLVNRSYRFILCMAGLTAASLNLPLMAGTAEALFPSLPLNLA